MNISAARTIAFDILRQVAAEDAYASDLLYTRLGTGIKNADAALATELTLGVLRWQRLLDFLLGRYVQRRCEDLDQEVLLALRLGLYQLRYLDRVPRHAAINESVELAKRARKGSAAGMVNAVLRRAAPDARIAGDELARLVPAGVSAEERLGLLYSHPTWLVERWIRSFGEKRTVALLAANNQPAHLTCAVLDEQETATAAESLRKSGLDVQPGRWLRSALRISGGDPATSEAFRSGQINLQDEASQMVAHLVDAQPSQTILDACAAPGGKTILLARAAGPRGKVLAGDLREYRLRALQRQLERTRTTNVRLVAFDGTKPWPFSERFDRILIDAPCSGTGTLSRNPEIRWRLQPRNLETASLCQAEMLRHALENVAKTHGQTSGGADQTVYSTCSLEPEENENVVAEVLSETPGWRVSSGQEALEPHLRNAAAAGNFFSEDGFFRTFPPEHGTDGFFAAVFVRRDV